MKTETENIIKGISIIGMIIVLIWIISAESGETYSEFSLANAQHSCQYNAEGDVSYWVWWANDILHKEEVGYPFSTNPPVKVSCYFLGGYPSNGCCPLGVQCIVDDCENPGFEGQCYGAAPPVCSDYNEYCNPKAYCEAFDPLTAIRSVEQFTGVEGICSGDYSIPVDIAGKTCEEYVGNCRCYWDDVDGECKSTSTNILFCDGVQYTGNCTQGSVIKKDQCNEKGIINYIWEANWSMSGDPPLTQNQTEAARPDYCKSGNKDFRCNMIRLSFFSFMNIVLFILIIIALYYFSDRKEESKDKDKKI